MATERTVLVRLKAHVSDFQRGMVAARGSLSELTEGIDTSNNRTAILAQSILGLGPAFVPLSAAAVPVLTGLSTQLLVAGGAAGVMTLAMVGIGQGLKALNDYQLEPTAENLQKMQIEMEKLGPSGEHFVRFLDEVGGQFKVLQTAARDGLFPGAEEGITHLLDLLPKVQVIVGRIADGLGQLSAEGGENLAGPKFTSFFEFLQTDAQPILLDMGHTLGNFVEGLANMTVAFAPLSRGFSSGLLDMSRAFAEWSRNLDSNQSFQDFLQYIQESGPRALDFLQALIEALASIVEAAAPVGAILLPALTQLLNVISAIAETPLGPVIVGLTAAISLYGRAVALASITTGGFFGKLTSGWRGAAGTTARSARFMARDFATVGTTMMTAGARTERASIQMKTATGRLAGLGKAAGGVALLGVAASGVADKVGLANTANLALMGTLLGPWGAAIGAATGLVLDMAAADKQAAEDARAWAEATSTSVLKVEKARIEAEKRAVGKRTPAADLVSVGAGYGAARQPKSTVSASDRDKLAAINRELTMRNAKEGAANMALLREGLNSTAEGSRRAAMTTSEFAASIVKMNEAITGERSLISYQASIDDFTASLKENGRTLDINTAKGRANKTALIDIAENALGVAKTLKGVDRERFLDNARRAFIRAAREAGLTRRAAERLANQLLGLDGIKPKPKVDLDTDRFRNKREAAIRALNDLNNRTAEPHVTLGTPAFYGALASVNAGLDAIDRRVVSPTVKTGKAYGGAIYGAGGPRDDKIPAMLSNGEHVWTAEEVAAAGGQAAVYAMRRAVMAGLPAFANGGAVDRARHTSVSVAAPRLDLGGVTVMVRLANGQTQRGTVERVVSGRGELLDARRRDGVRT